MPERTPRAREVASRLGIPGADLPDLSTYLVAPLAGAGRRHRRRLVNARALRLLVEVRVRRLVAENLGVDVLDLSPEVSLIDELAADSLDLMALARELEAAFDIAVPEQVLAGVRTYGDLIQVTLARVRACRQAEAERGSVSCPGGAARSRR